MRARWRFLAAVLLLGLAPAAATPAASTSDLEREKNWAGQIVDYLVVGEAVYLEAGGVRFLSLYTRPAEAHKDSGRGVILLHGRGAHPAWGFIDTLRADLAEAGWHTLSLQLPILDPGAKLIEYGRTFPEAFRRIQAGIGYLRQNGVSRIVLVGHSLGAMTAVAFAAEHPGTGLAGVGAIGLATEPSGNRFLQTTALLEKVRVPVLDIFGGGDLPSVRDHAQARAAAAKKAGNAGYRQVRVQGANHFFTDHYDDLRINLSDWLKEVAADT